MALRQDSDYSNYVCGDPNSGLSNVAMRPESLTERPPSSLAQILLAHSLYHEEPNAEEASRRYKSNQLVALYGDPDEPTNQSLDDPQLDDTSSSIVDTPLPSLRPSPTSGSSLRDFCLDIFSDESMGNDLLPFNCDKAFSVSTEPHGFINPLDYLQPHNVENPKPQISAALKSPGPSAGDESVDCQVNSKGTLTQKSDLTTTTQSIAKIIGNKDIESTNEQSTTKFDCPGTWTSKRACEEPAIRLLPSISTSRFRVPSQCSLSSSSPITEYDSIVSSEFEDEANEINQSPLQPLASLILDELLRVFFCGHSPLLRECHKSVQSGNTTSQSQNYVSDPKQGDDINGGSKTSSRRKRKRQNSEERDSGDEGDEGKHPSKKLAVKPSVEAEPIFWACPFSKWKPLSYRKCYQYVLKDISRVKQHLRRYHERPHYCPVCWEVFREEDEFETHIQGRYCSPRPKVDVEGVSSAQQKQLERRSDKQLSKPEQWYAVYETLFPGQPRPDNPYIESDLSAELISFQRFMATEGLAVVERKARENIPAHLVPHEDELLLFSQVLFQQAVPEILRKYDATRSKNDNSEVPKEHPPPGLLFNLDSDSGFGTISPGSIEMSNLNRPYDPFQSPSTDFESLPSDWTSLNYVDPTWEAVNPFLNWDTGNRLV
ncbi:hypothetical protein F5Y13DRAFT_170563 [Hypoxylon sp. FL1857]|nr:hypothetical protein F5Y13DRAFT_170563 [Hypoxylon sp. FL1857]